MPITTLAAVKAYAEQRFPETFVQLPHPDSFLILEPLHFASGNAVLRAPCASIYKLKNGNIVFKSTDLNSNEPFCWVSDIIDDQISSERTSAYETNLTAFVRYCTMVLDPNSAPQQVPDKFSKAFEAACAEIQKGLNDKRNVPEAASEENVPWGPTACDDRVEQLTSRIATLQTQTTTENDLLILRDAVSKKGTHEVEQKVAARSLQKPVKLGTTLESKLADLKARLESVKKTLGELQAAVDNTLNDRSMHREAVHGSTSAF